MEEAVISHLTKRIVVVTGANKGIGLEICKQLAFNGITVILIARDEKRGLEGVQNLKASGLSHILFHQLEVTDHTSIASLLDFIKTKFKKLDISVNNAAISGTTIDEEVRKGLTFGYDNFILNEEVKKELSDTDGLTEEKVDDVIKGFLEDFLETNGWPIKFFAYTVFKAALNAYTKVLAKKYPNIAMSWPCQNRPQL